MRLTPFARLPWPLRSGLAALAALPLVACGKDDNIHEPSLLEFRHTLPEAPRPLDTPTDLTELPSLSGHPIVATDHHLYLTDRDNRAVVRLDRATLARENAITVDGRPEQIALNLDDRLFVSLRSGEVLRLSPDLVIEGRVKLGIDAHGVALSPDGKTLYATLPHAGELVTLDALTLEELDRAALGFTPRGLAVSPKGWLVVSNENGDGVRVDLDVQGLPLGGLADIALRKGNPNEFVRMSSRLTGMRATRSLAATVSPETGGIFLAHITAAPGDPANLANLAKSGNDAATVGYGGASNAITFDAPVRPIEVSITPTTNAGTPGLVEADIPVKDVLSGEPLIDLIDQPSDILHHPTWSLLFMTGYGTDNVLVLSTAEGDPMRSPVGVIDVGHAPRGIAIAPDGQTAYVLNEHDLSVSRIDLAPFFAMEPAALPTFEAIGFATSFAAPTPDFSMSNTAFAATDPTPDSPRVRPVHLRATSSAAYATDPLPPEVRRGARVFTFARNENLSHAGQFACASCHFEGTEDKLVWIISDGPRQTPSLAGRLAGTAPFNWAGTKDALQDNMAQTITRMGGTGLDKAELADLEQFLLHGLEAPHNPNLAPDGTLTADQLAGKAIFESSQTGCANCHQPERNFTDGLTHDVGTGSEAERILHDMALIEDPEVRAPWILDTPTLKGLFYTAPYFHDGSAADLWAVLDREGSRMGSTKHLTYDAKRQLIAYLMTL